MTEAMTLQGPLLEDDRFYNDPIAADLMAAEAPQEAERAGFISRNLTNLKRAGAVAIAAIGMGGAMAETAYADAPVAPELPAPTVTITENSVSLGSSSATDSDFASGKIHIGANVVANGIKKTEIKKAKKLDNCVQVGDGTKYPDAYNSYKDVNGKLVFFRDHHKNTVCFIKGQWRKIAGSGPNKGNCGNIYKFKKPADKKLVTTGRILLVRDFANASLNGHAEAKAYAAAGCANPDGSAYALASASAIATSDYRIRVQEIAKSNGAAITRLGAEVSGKAVANAAANATAICAEKGQVTVQVTPVEGTDICVNIDGVQEQVPAGDYTDDQKRCFPGKNPSEGAGTGTTGNTSTGSTPGGQGAGQTGPTGPSSSTTNPNAGKTCYDSNRANDGDQKTTTEGALMYQGAGGEDQNQECVGKADGFVPTPA